MTLRVSDQHRRDHNRKTYRLTFPMDMSHEQVVAWIRSIAGGLRPTKLGSKPTIAFELWSTSTGIFWRIKVPWQEADTILTPLIAHIPGVTYTPEEEWPERPWTRAVELSLKHKVRSLSIVQPEEVAKTILANIQPLEGREAIIVQWVVSPLPPQTMPVMGKTKRASFGFGDNMASADEVRERREKLSVPNLAGVLRIATYSETIDRADHLIHRVKVALASTHSRAVKFEKRLYGTKEVVKRIADATATLTNPIQLSAYELSAVIGWPIGNPLVIGLPQATARRLPPNEAIPSHGLVLGYSNFAGRERKVAVGYTEALMHTLLLGSTGTGKSTLAAHAAKQIMDEGYGLVLIETSGDLYQMVLDYIPKHRVDDVVLLDFQDRQHPVGFNLFDQGNPAATVDQLMSLFIHKYGGGVWIEEYFYHALRTLAETPGTSFTDIAALLLPRTDDEITWADELTRNVKDNELRKWWARHENRNRAEQQQRTDPVLSRIANLATRPETRYVMGQANSTLNIANVLRNNSILLVNLKGVGKETAGLVGTLLMDTLWQAVKDTPKDIPTYFVLDEFAEYMDLPVNLETMFAQARKHNFGMIVATQHLSQLPHSMRDTVVTNARNTVSFTTNTDDATTLAREFGAYVDAADLKNLRAYEAVARVQTPTGASTPVTIRTIPRGKKLGNAGEAIYRSRAKYGRALEDVTAEMENRHKIDRPARPRPSIGTVDPPL